jgi:hypothetical protein
VEENEQDIIPDKNPDKEERTLEIQILGEHLNEESRKEHMESSNGV